jgi:hypothetical protein
MPNAGYSGSPVRRRRSNCTASRPLHGRREMVRPPSVAQPRLWITAGTASADVLPYLPVGPWAANGLIVIGAPEVGPSFALFRTKAEPRAGPWLNGPGPLSVVAVWERSSHVAGALVSLLEVWPCSREVVSVPAVLPLGPGWHT